MSRKCQWVKQLVLLLLSYRWAVHLEGYLQYPCRYPFISHTWVETSTACNSQLPCPNTMYQVTPGNLEHWISVKKGYFHIFLPFRNVTNHRCMVWMCLIELRLMSLNTKGLLMWDPLYADFTIFCCRLDR